MADKIQEKILSTSNKFFFPSNLSTEIFGYNFKLPSDHFNVQVSKVDVSLGIALVLALPVILVLIKLGFGSGDKPKLNFNIKHPYLTNDEILDGSYDFYNSTQNINYNTENDVKKGFFDAYFSKVEKVRLKFLNQINGFTQKFTGIFQKVKFRKPQNTQEDIEDTYIRDPGGLKNQGAFRNPVNGGNAGGISDIGGNDIRYSYSIGSPGIRPSVNTESRPGVNTGSRPGVNTESKPGVNTGSRPGVNPESRPGVNTGSRPSVNTGSRPGVYTGSRPGVSSGNRPSFDVGEDINYNVRDPDENNYDFQQFQNDFQNDDSWSSLKNPQNKYSYTEFDPKDYFGESIVQNYDYPDYHMEYHSNNRRTSYRIPNNYSQNKKSHTIGIDNKNNFDYSYNKGNGFADIKRIKSKNSAIDIKNNGNSNDTDNIENFDIVANNNYSNNESSNKDELEEIDNNKNNNDYDHSYTQEQGNNNSGKRKRRRKMKIPQNE